ncbi:MAG: hypothetical protein Q9165_000906 [Trypethelium subeluteriae]
MSCKDDYISDENIRLLSWHSKAAQRSLSVGENMFFSAVIAGLVGLACASPAPKPASETKLARRQTGPNYTVYTFDQLVRLFVLVIIVRVLTVICRSTIFQTVIAIRRTPMIHSSKDMSMIRLITSLGVPSSSTLVERQAWNLDMKISNREVSCASEAGSVSRQLLNEGLSVIQILMNATNGLGIILENRFYGDSYPLPGSTTDELRFLTTEQSSYAPIQKFAPQDCVASINAIIDKMDYLVSTNNTAAIQELKNIFGLGSLGDIRDFAMTIAFPLGGPMNYPTNTWQELNWSPLYGSNDFWNFCNNVSDINAPANITAVDNQLAKYTNGQPWTNLGNYANYVKQIVLPYCTSGDYDSTSDTCFSTQNGNTSFGLLRLSGEADMPSLVLGGYNEQRWSLLFIFNQQWCTWAFPPGEYNTIPSTPDLTQYTKYGDFNFSAPRLAFIDGNQDVWLDLCYHSNDAPARYSSDLHPEHLIAGAGHHWDSYGIKDIPAEPQFIRNAHYWEIRTVQKWLRSSK